MSKHTLSTSRKTHQITNRPTNQGRPGLRLCLCDGYRDSLSASALAGVEGYTKSTLSQGAGGRLVDSPVKGPHLRNLPAMHSGFNIRRVNLSLMKSIVWKGV
jgi:hypothetical protein